MQVQGTVISISLETDVKKQNGGTYKAWELVYKTPDGEVRTVAKPVQGLRFNAPLKASLANLGAGDEFTLVQDKNDAGFYDVKSIEKGFVVAEHSPDEKPKGARVTNADNTNAYKSTYETPEERAIRRAFEEKKQTLIIRQSSLTTAIAAASAGIVSVPKGTKGLITLAKELEEYVVGGNPRQLAEAAVANLEDDIPE